MIERVLLAASNSYGTAEAAGRVMGTLLFPALGLLLLVLGLRQRRRSRQAAQAMNTPYPYPGSPVPPSPAGKSQGTALIVVGSVLLVLSLLGLAGSLASIGLTSLRGLSTGQCISEKDYAAANSDAAPADCQREDAVYELAFKGDGSATCPDGKRDDSGYAVLTNGSRTYCFILNAREGVCYQVDDAKHVFSPVACTSKNAPAKIVRRIDGSTDLTQCAAETRGFSFPTPPRLYCATAP